MKYERSQFFLYDSVLTGGNESDFMPRIKDFEFKIVTHPTQLDELIEQGLCFPFDRIRSDHRRENAPELVEQELDFPLNRLRTEYRLKKGAIAFFIFVERELAAMGWVAMTRKAQASLFDYPYRVDFSKREACIGGAWTNPKFRSKNLHTYITYKRQEYLREQGIILARSIISVGNTASRKVHEKFSPQEKIYGKASYLKLFGIRIWKKNIHKKTPFISLLSKSA